MVNDGSQGLANDALPLAPAHSIEEGVQMVEEVRETVVLAGNRRIRLCLMTSATTILALLPVLSSTVRGSDVMVPMAIPSFGGMLMVLVSVFVVPVLYAWICERQLAKGEQNEITE